MTNTFLIQFIEILSFTLQVLILIRVLLSWIKPHPSGPAGRFLIETTDPILRPFQRLIPPMAGIDLSPIAALVTIQLLASLATRALG
ncbi:MAG TPA: YggT family protein [Patescibacteria group bacterium]|jgi:YggT family protein